jgi:hypothetical protein
LNSSDVYLVAGGIPAIVECFELLVQGLSIRLVLVVVGLYLILYSSHPLRFQQQTAAFRL